MKHNQSNPIVGNIILPFFCAILLGLAPQGLNIRDAWQDAIRAAQQKQPAGQVIGFTEIISIQPWRGDIWQSLGFQYFENGEWEKSISAFQTAKELHGLAPSGSIRMGEAYLQSGNQQAALDTWIDLISNGEESPEVYSLVVSLLEKNGQYEQAAGYIKKWLILESTNAELYYHLGLILLLNQPADALMYVEKSLELDISKTFQAEHIKTTITTALSSDDPAFQQLVIGRALAHLSQWNLAEVAFQNAVDINPAYADAWAFLGEARQQMGRNGLVELQRACATDPDSIAGWALLGLYWRRNGKPELALAGYKQAASIQPGEPTWEIEIGSILAEMGDLESAAVHYQAAVALDIDNINSLIQQAQFCIANGYAVRGIGLPAARQALLLSPQDPTGLATMGSVMLALDDNISAERFLLKSLEVDPFLATAHLRLAQVYLEESRPDEAYRQLRLVLDDTRSDDAAVTFAQRLLKQYYGINEP